MKTKLLILVLSTTLLTNPLTAVAATKPPPTATPAAKKPSATAAADITKPVKFGPTKTYKHESGWISIDVPTSWTAKDSSTVDKEVVVTFLDPTGNAAILIQASPKDGEVSQDELGTYLTDYLKDRFSEQKKLSVGDPKPLNDNGASTGFEYETTVDGKLLKIYGDSYLTYNDQKLLTVVTWIVPGEQYEKTKTQVRALLETFRAYPDAVSAPNKGLQIDTLTPYKHKSGAFSISYPAEWEVSDQSTKGNVLVSMIDADGRGAIIISAVKNKGAALKTKALETQVVAFAKRVFGKNKGYAVNTPKSKGNTASVTFNYTSPNGLDMTGIAYVDQVDTTISSFTMVVPADRLTDLSDKLDEIDNSLKVSGKATF